jgi:hypothetical protein
MPYGVFLSHGWHDHWLAKQMARCMTADAKAAVFVDFYDIKHGDRIEEKIQQGLLSCNELVALITPWSVKRTWVWAEIGSAWGVRKRVVGVLYGLTLDDMQKEYGGSACLGATNCAQLNEFDTYVGQLSERVKQARIR